MGFSGRAFDFRDDPDSTSTATAKGLTKSVCDGMERSTVPAAEAPGATLATGRADCVPAGAKPVSGDG